MTGDAARAARATAAAVLPDRIAFLGLGLIGGSIALALREAGATARFAGWTPSGRGPAEVPSGIGARTAGNGPNCWTRW